MHTPSCGGRRTPYAGVWLSALVGAAGALAVAATAPPQIAAQGAASQAVAIPFELATRHVIVKVTVNNSRPLSFVLDTGASVAMIRTDVARELGLPLYGSARIGGAGPGTQEGSLVKGATWSLVGFDGFSQPLALALPFPELPAAMGRDTHGIIGGEFIKQFVLELDYQSRIIRLHNRQTFAYAGPGETIPIEFNRDGHPVLEAAVTTMDGRSIVRRFHLDIGSGRALVLHSPFVAEQNLLGPHSTTIPAIGMRGAGGRTSGRIGRVAALRIGSHTIDRPITVFSQDKAGAFANASLAGNIGAEIVSRFRTFFDYGRRRIILEPSSIFGEPFERAFSGLSLRAEGADYRTFRVREVLEQSAASEAGIREGDVITAINGTPASELTLSTINEMLEKPVAYKVTLRRDDETVSVALTPRQLI